MEEGNTRRGQFGRRLALYGAGLLTVGGILLAVRLRTPKPDLESILEKVYEASGREDYPAAHQLLDEAQDIHPDALRVDLTRGWLFEMQKDLAEARRVYGALTARCEDPEQRRDLEISVADLARRQGNRAEAEALLAGIERNYGRSARSRHLRILLQMDSEDYAGALSEARLWAEEGPGDSKAQRLVKTLANLVENNSQGKAEVEPARVASRDVEPKVIESTTSLPTEAKVQGDPLR